MRYEINSKEIKLIGQVLLSKRLTEQSRSFAVETIRRFLSHEIFSKERFVVGVVQRDEPELYKEITSFCRRGTEGWYRDIIFESIRKFVEKNPGLMVYPRFGEMREAIEKRDQADVLLAAFDSAVGYTDGE